VSPWPCLCLTGLKTLVQGLGVFRLTAEAAEMLVMVMRPVVDAARPPRCQIAERIWALEEPTA
jgi:hypothetical protein